MDKRSAALHCITKGFDGVIYIIAKGVTFMWKSEICLRE